MDNKDIKILREYAKRIKEISSEPTNLDKKEMWKSSNGLNPVRTMVAVVEDQLPWNEMEYDHELTLQCEDEFCRSLEWNMLKRLYIHNHLNDDTVIEESITIPLNIVGLSKGFDSNMLTPETLGIPIKEDTLETDIQNCVVSHSYTSVIKDYEDITKIKIPNLYLNESETLRRIEAASEVFHGILNVEKQCIIPWFAAWDILSQWMKIEEIYFDLLDRPEFIHAVMDRTIEAFNGILTQLESQNLLTTSHYPLGGGCLYTYELPSYKEGAKVKEMWGAGAAQLFSSVSAGMYQEFDTNHVIDYFSRFGLTYYGCCEPLHDKVDILKKIPNLRKISMSPWANPDRGAEAIGSAYVYSGKVNPANVASVTFQPDIVENEIRHITQSCKKNNTPCEIILKDVSTVSYKPQNLKSWCDIAMKIANG